jgi:hypothetical protein
MSSSSTDLILDEWQHVAIVRSGSSGAWHGQYYLNGTPDGSFDTPVNPRADTIPLSIGRTGEYQGEYFTGLIDELIDIEAALSHADIRRLMMGLHPF